MWGRAKKKHDIAPRRRRTQESERSRQTEDTNLFRRNRTLVGSISPLVRSASELNAHMKSPRAHTHHLVRHRRHLGALFLLFFASALFLLWFLYEFTAATLVTSSNVESSRLEAERYQKTIADYISNRPLERLRPLLNEEQLLNYLRQTRPEVKALADIGPGGLATTTVDITFRQPVASWVIDSRQFYVDKNGVLFQRNYFDEPKVKVVDNSGIPQSAATTIASSRFLQFVGLAVDAARTFGLEVDQATIPRNTTRQLELRLSGRAYPVKLSLDRPIGEQIEDTKQAVSYLDAKNITPKYIDVRISGRAYYKL